MHNPGKNTDIPRNASTAYSYIAVVFEFVGIIGVLALLGYMIDTRFFSIPGNGIFLLIGMLIGFIYGFVHLLRRVKGISERITREAKSGPALNRNGYPEDLDERIAKVDSSLENVKRRIDELPDSGDSRR